MPTPACPSLRMTKRSWRGLSERLKESKFLHMIKKPLIWMMFRLLPSGQCGFIASKLFGELVLAPPVNPPIFPNLVSESRHFLFKRVAAQELDNLRNLGQGWPDPVPLPEVDRGVRNIKVEGELALGELQIQPPALDPITPRSANIRVFLPVGWLSCP